ncbi:MAG: ligase-associated DNA damage response endonuclease PdeM [Chitinophagaceae bacterium]|nr:ligase-associated DNA damage response endonuclease PdeM [Chitinophagaceae bacterium]
MQPPVKHIIAGNTFWLSAHRAVYWEEDRSLIVADLHLGKSGHFRKSGIGIPQTVFKEDMLRLVNLLQFFKPARLIVVGDMFHSHANKEMDLFSRWRNDFPNLQVQLVKGNHDILNPGWYTATGIEVHHETLEIGGFVFRHEDEPVVGKTLAGKYLFTGHIHPGVRVSGPGKQKLSFPCFHFSHRSCILPAFSRFTGLVSIHRNRTDKIFAIVEDKVLLL